MKSLDKKRLVNIVGGLSICRAFKQTVMKGSWHHTENKTHLQQVEIQECKIIEAVKSSMLEKKKKKKERSRTE